MILGAYQTILFLFTVCWWSGCSLVSGFCISCAECTRYYSWTTSKQIHFIHRGKWEVKGVTKDINLWACYCLIYCTVLCINYFLFQFMQQACNGALGPDEERGVSLGTIEIVNTCPCSKWIF